MVQTIAVSDSRSNRNDQIAHAVRVLGRSRQRAAVFRAICHGKKRFKTPEEIAQATRLPRKRVLEEAAKLANQHVIFKSRSDGQVRYERDPFYAANRSQILTLWAKPSKLKHLPTKTNPAERTSTVRLVLPKSRARVSQITIDDIASLSRVRKTREFASVSPPSETVFKRGIQQLLGEPGTFKDWGGERNDLFSTRAVVSGKRRPTAFAFKGPATTGKLTPKKMGKNADQIQRLFLSPAEVFFVQYWGPIDESVLEQMRLFAIATAFKENRRVWFGTVDQADSARLVAAYPAAFSTP